MPSLAGFPYFEVAFDKDGQIVDKASLLPLLAALAPGATPAITDLLVMSHGWNNDMADARDLYQRFFTTLRAELARQGTPSTGWAVVGVFWPSKRFADRDLIPGGAASLNDLAADALASALDQLAALLDDPGATQQLAQAKALIDNLDDETVQDRWVNLVRSLFPDSSPDREEGMQELQNQPGRVLLDQLKSSLLPPAEMPSGAGGAAGGIGDDEPDPAQGGSLGLGDFLDGIKGGALRALNLFTYYTMKDRAGMVGINGVNPLLRQAQAVSTNLNLHLIGHSFGGRVVTAAASGPAGQPPLRLRTMTLLQAAFSHYGFAKNYEPGKDGFFRAVPGNHKVSGPILITHSKRDTAVGIAYAIASRAAGQIAAGLGDASDRFGGIGRNGAQSTPEAVTGNLLPVGGQYSFAAGSVYNLHADELIMSHGDIVKPEIAYALTRSIGTAHPAGTP